MPQIIKNYRDNEALRQSFNALANETFGLDFEKWYQNGFWGDDYNPYSVLVDGKIVANVSLNRTDLRIGGQRKRLCQLGTVMTAKGYRNRGCIRAIMAEIAKDTADADGVYLFANDTVLDFYPKFGFTKGTEYVYYKVVSQDGPCRMQNVPMDNAAGWDRLEKAMEENTFRSACEMVGNPGLIFFYVSQFMQDCVFYEEEMNTWVIAERENGNLLIHNIFSNQSITLDDVIRAFGSGVNQVTLGFTPEDPSGFNCRTHKEEDCTFFIKREVCRDFRGEETANPQPVPRVVYNIYRWLTKN